MKTKKASREGGQEGPRIVRQPALYHRLDALLHAMRCISQYEDVLCEISHELKMASVPSRETLEELRNILEKMPALDYLADLELASGMLPAHRR